MCSGDYSACQKDHSVVIKASKVLKRWTQHYDYLRCFSFLIHTTIAVFSLEKAHTILSLNSFYALLSVPCIWLLKVAHVKKEWNL